MVRRIGSQIRDQWMGALALFLVLAGGTAYAANTVLSTDIVDGQVKTPDLAGGAVTVAKIADGSITGDKVKDGALQGRDVLDNSLKGADIDESTLAGGGNGQVGPAEGWHAVVPGSTSGDMCADPGVTGVFCTAQIDFDFNVWRNYGDAFAPAAFYRDQLGIVHLRGLVQNPALTIDTDFVEFPIFRLPEGYRPVARRVFPSVGSSWPSGTAVAQARVDVQPNGLVTLVQACGVDGDSMLEDCSGTGGDLTLEGIAFRPN